MVWVFPRPSKEGSNGMQFERVLRAQVVLKLAELAVEFGGVFAGQDGVAREEAVLERVE